MEDTEISKQILQIKQAFVKNPNWQKADQVVIYKAWRRWNWHNQKQIRSVAGSRSRTQNLRMTNPAP